MKSTPNRDVPGPDLTILLPCLNEAETVGECVTDAWKYLNRARVTGEVVVADNGSTDGSQEVAARAGARVIHVAEKGYGNAIRGGIDAARGRWILMADADGTYDLAALDPFVDRLSEGSDFVVGNRYKGGIDEEAMPFLNRYLGTPVLSFLGRLFFGVPVGDFNCGIRAFSRDAVVQMGLTSPGMELASEMIVKAGLYSLEISEVPATLSADTHDREPHLQPWRDGWRHLRLLLLLCPRWLFLYPGLALMAVGTGLMAWLLPGGRSLGAVGLDVNTLAYASAAVTCGFLAVAFWVFARVMGARRGWAPADDLGVRIARSAKLEAGVLVGMGLMIIGFMLGLYAVGTWGSQSFGALDPQESLRTVIPSVTTLILGLEILFCSFFLHLLELEQSGTDAT